MTWIFLFIKIDDNFRQISYYLGRIFKKSDNVLQLFFPLNLVSVPLGYLHFPDV